jgi:hypothetical protein
MPSQVFEFTILVDYPPQKPYSSICYNKIVGFANPTPIEPKFPPTLNLSTFVSEGLFLIQPLAPSTIVVSHDTKPPSPRPIHLL